MIDGKAALMIASTLAGAVSLWAVAWAWSKWLTRPRHMNTLPQHDARLDRIEQAVEAIAIEVERIGEGQRAAMRAVGERRPEGASYLPAQPRPMVTPH